MSRLLTYLQTTHPWQMQSLPSLKQMRLNAKF